MTEKKPTKFYFFLSAKPKKPPNFAVSRQVFKQSERNRAEQYEGKTKNLAFDFCEVFCR